MSAEKNSMEQKEPCSVVGHADKEVIVSKQEAKILGVKHYFTGIPCKRGHVDPRLVSTGSCVGCMKIYKSGKSFITVKKPNGYWMIRDNVKNEAAKFKSKSEMKSKSYPAYLGMCALKISDELFPGGKKSNGYWTLERCVIAAKKYSNLDEFSRSPDAKAYQYLSARGIVREHTKHMNHKKREGNHWNHGECIKEALKYKTRNEFRSISNGAYDSCRTNGWLNEACSHMISGYKVSDCVYIWEVEGLSVDDLKVFKIGIAKKTLVDRRINAVSKAHGFIAGASFSFKVGNPHLLESVALKLGKRVDLPKLDGYTEFRALTPEDFKKCIDLFKENEIVSQIRKHNAKTISI